MIERSVDRLDNRLDQLQKSIELAIAAIILGLHKKGIFNGKEYAEFLLEANEVRKDMDNERWRLGIDEETNGIQ